MELWVGAVNLGLLYAVMSIGAFISFKIYNFADITVESSFTTGAATSAVLILAGWNPFLSLIFAFLAGSVTGWITGVIHTRFKINVLLAGILVMTGLYSVNLRIMNKSNLPLMNVDTFMDFFEKFNPGIHPELWLCVCISAALLFFWLFISVFFKTDLGITMRATGNNPIMVAANGKNVNWMIVFGLMLSNGFTGISGALVAQYQGFADIGMGIGSMVFSLAAIIIGEAIIKHKSIFIKVLSAILGSIIFRLMVALALYLGMNPNDLKLITAMLVLIILVASGTILSNLNLLNLFKKVNKKIWVAVGILAFLAVAGHIYFNYIYDGVISEKMPKIGIILPNESEAVIISKDGFLHQLKLDGFEDGKNCKIIIKSASGDIPTLPTIVNSMVNEGVDLYVAISTPSLQAVSNIIKDKPVLFLTVADPFITGVGKTDTDHPDNITGTYGAAPLEKTLEMLKEFFPNKIHVGVIYNPTYLNSVFNFNHLKKALEPYKEIEMSVVSVSGTNEVFQAAQSLVNRKIDAFFLVPDHCVFTAFESIVKVAQPLKIPIFNADIEKLQAGALLVNGYDYYGCAMQTAKIATRILNGENPKNIPYEKHKLIATGFNYDVAKQLNITIPEKIKSKLNLIYEDGKLTKLYSYDLDNNKPKTKPVRVAFFQFSDNTLYDDVHKGINDAVKKYSLDVNYNLIVTKYSANGDYATGQSIAKNIIEQGYDYVISGSTTAGQIMAKNNSKIPHIFCSVTDPVQSGIVKSFTNHPAYMTGIATPQPIPESVEMLRNNFPDYKKIGVIWNSAESNSEINVKRLAAELKKYKIILVERTVTSTAEVEEALNSLISEDIDLFINFGDNIVTNTFPSVTSKLQQKKIPCFSNVFGEIDKGAMLSMGADYYDVGAKSVEILNKILNGTSPGDIDVEIFMPLKIGVNLQVAQSLGVIIPNDLQSKAKKVVR